MDSPTEPIDAASAADVLDLLPPFPLVLVTTRTNVLTVGQVEYFTFSPLRIGIAIAHSRHSWSLIRAERQFVVNVPDAAMLAAVRVCGSVSGRDGDKFPPAGLTPVASAEVEAVSIAECGAHIECAVEREIDFEDRTWFIGPVVAARKRPDHHGMNALLCGRTEYSLPGKPLGPR